MYKTMTLPAEGPMSRQRERLLARSTHYAEQGEFSVLVTKESGITGTYWYVCVRKGSEVVDRDIHYAGPELAEKRAGLMLARAVKET